MHIRNVVAAALLLCLGFAGQASADTIFNARVIALGPDTYPFQGVVFKVDQPGSTGACVGNPWIYYHYTSTTDNGMVASDNLKAVYALILAAWLSAQPITVFTSSTPAPNGGCAAVNVGPKREQ